MIEEESMTVDESPTSGQAEERQQFSDVQGFQLVSGRICDLVDAERRDAVILELEGRAARFHRAVDASIVLSNDGAIRWSGEPIARLAPGPNLLTPRAVILADDALPDGAREALDARLQLWLESTARRLLGPLYALEALQEAPDAVCDLAGRLAASLGVLDRGPIRRQIRALDQNARATLRNHHVRFGAYYIYVPSMLKPAARSLAVQLWGLRTPGETESAQAQILISASSSGRTSLPCDRSISGERYLIAGFRPCGDRIVRVDIVERLADAIRAATIKGSGAGETARAIYEPSRGFMVSQEMTSLTGCSGEHFASILRSLDFECVEVKRSELAGPPIEQSGNGETRWTESGRLKAETDPEGDPGALAMAPLPATPAAIIDPGGVSSDTISLWRPARRSRPTSQMRPHVRQTRDAFPETEAAAPRLDDGHGHSAGRPGPGRNRDFVGGRRPERSAPSAGEPAGLPPPAVTPAVKTDSGENRRQAARNCDKPRNRSESGPRNTTTFDPNSPFAKLVELRSLFEEQSKKHK